MQDLLDRMQAAVDRIQDDKVSIGELADLHGQSAHGAMLVFLSVLTILPVPFSGLAFSFGLFAVAWMMWKDDHSHGLPQAVCKVTMPPATARRMINTLKWIYTQAARFSRPRLGMLTSPATRVWMVPFVALMAFIIFLPIPFGNGAPAVALIFLGLGLMGRDGLAVLLGLLTGAVAVGVIVVLAWSALWVIGA